MCLFNHYCLWLLFNHSVFPKITAGKAGSAAGISQRKNLWGEFYRPDARALTKSVCSYEIVVVLVNCTL